MLAEAIEKRFDGRREEWDREDSELRSVIGMVGGSGGWGTMMERLGLRSSTPQTLSAMNGGSGKAISGRFDSAMTTDDNRAHWAMADGLAADAAANPMIRYVLRNRSRYEAANNCYCRGVGETIANDFVGTGPRLHIDDDRLSDEERADVEAKWQAWANAIDLPGKLRVMRKARRQDGETFACKITNPNLNHPVKLDLRVVEADQVRFVDIALLLTPSVDGIRYDDFGNPVSYNILRVHPGFWSYATGYVGFPWEYDEWDAKLVIHWFRQDRPGQHRGLPEFLAALPLYATLRRYTQATLDAAETAADFAILLKTESGAQFVDDTGQAVDPTMVAPLDSIPLKRRMLTTLPAGYDATQLHPEQPTQSYGEFKREICGEIGRCECVTLNVVLGDSSQSNMASGTLDHKLYYRPREIEREEANRLILDNLFSDFIREGVRIREGNGDMGKPYLPQILRTLGSSVSHTYHWDSNVLGDPLKLAAAQSAELKNGTTTIPAEYAKKGLDWQKAFKAAARCLGIKVEEYQQLIRDTIFTTMPEPSAEGDGEEGGEDGEKKKNSKTPSVKRPGQAAMQKA
jgi:hypothetical protein